MKPTIILFGPATLTAAWLAAVTSTPRPLLAVDEVFAVSDPSAIEPAIEGDGKNQLFVAVLGPRTFGTIAAAKAQFPKLAFAVAENPQASAAELEAAWADANAGVADYRIVRDMGTRDGTSFYGAAKRFLEILPLLQ
jgi:hypothetical protein